MTATLVSLISILVGILGANIYGILYKKYSYGIVGNTIAGVFGSIFLIKSFGRLGFRPNNIIINGEIYIKPFMINIIVSIIGGFTALIFLKIAQKKLNTSFLK